MYSVVVTNLFDQSIETVALVVDFPFSPPLVLLYLIGHRGFRLRFNELSW